jgi:hypothetical protein
LITVAAFITSFSWGPLQKFVSHLVKQTRYRPSQTHAVSLFCWRSSRRLYALLLYVSLERKEKCTLSLQPLICDTVFPEIIIDCIGLCINSLLTSLSRFCIFGYMTTFKFSNCSSELFKNQRTSVYYGGWFGARCALSIATTHPISPCR